MNYDFLKKQFKIKGYRIKDIAFKIGMSEQGVLSAIKNQTLKIRDLEKIAEALGVDINIFFGADKDATIKQTIVAGDKNLIESKINNSSADKIKSLEKEIEYLKTLLEQTRNENAFLKTIIEKKL